MKKVTSNSVAALIAVTSISILAGCGKGNSNNPSNSVYGSVPGGVYGTPYAGSNGACIPINSPQIPFTGSNIYYDAYNIVGGIVPNAGVIGQMFVGGAATGGPYQRSGVDGSISMSIMTGMGAYPSPYPPSGSTYTGMYPTSYPGTYPGYGGGGATVPTRANASGFVSISSITQQDIMYKFGGSMPYGGTYNPTYPSIPGAMPQPMGMSMPCVSGIAINVGHTYNTNIIYGGHVYLYLNGSTQHGYALYF